MPLTFQDRIRRLCGFGEGRDEPSFNGSVLDGGEVGDGVENCRGSWDGEMRRRLRGGGLRDGARDIEGGIEILI